MQQLGNDCRNHGFGGPAGAVIAFERNAEAKFWKRRAIDAFGPTLHKDSPRRGLHG